MKIVFIIIFIIIKKCEIINKIKIFVNKTSVIIFVIVVKYIKLSTDIKVYNLTTQQ